jgi:hypothetical protein
VVDRIPQSTPAFVTGSIANPARKHTLGFRCYRPNLGLVGGSGARDGDRVRDRLDD